VYRPQAVKAFGSKANRERRKVMWYVTLVSSMLFGLAIGAFVFLSLIVVGYAGPMCQNHDIMAVVAKRHVMWLGG
jgi:hypothetical protein